MQSLRGVAALTVVVSHMTSIYLIPTAARIAIDAFFNPHASIIFFFVLSGYVLSGSLLRRGLSWTSVKGFYIGRLFRLFPALWAASLISASLLLLLPQRAIHPAESFWFYLYLPPFPSAARLLLALLAIDRSLIMPVWTVFVELMGSAIMPVLLALTLAKTRLSQWVLAGMATAAYLMAYAPHRLNSLAYMFDFALGAWLASGRVRFFQRRSLTRLVAAALTLIFFRFLWFSILFGHPMPLFGYDDPLPMLVEGLAAFLLIGELSPEHGRFRLLRNRWAVGLGNVSYGLYLIHFPVAIALAKVLSRPFADHEWAVSATAVLTLLGIPISLGFALLFYHFVELPSIAFGKRVVKRLTGDTTPIFVG